MKESPLFGLEPEHIDTGIQMHKESPKSAKQSKYLYNKCTLTVLTKF